MKRPIKKLPSNQIPKVIKSPNYLHSKHLMLKWNPTNQPTQAQVIIPLRYYPKAVERTKLKRRLRPFLTHPQLSDLHSDILLVAKKGAEETSTGQLKSKFIFLIRQAISKPDYLSK